MGGLAVYCPVVSIMITVGNRGVLILKRRVSVAISSHLYAVGISNTDGLKDYPASGELRENRRAV